jgi:GH25 family lysozyme M1 (1,4-beta-N-acetylmuramidase)
MDFTPVKKIPDISFWQDDNKTPQKVNFVKMRTQTEGVIIRAGQNSWVDEDFAYNWSEAKKAGLKRGIYWFFDPRYEPVAQANLFYNQFKNDPPEWYAWLDFEHTWDGAYNSEAYSKKFVSAIKSLYPKIGIYTANWWWKYKDDTFWSEFPLWVAQYVSNPAYVTIPSSWRNRGKKAVLWQYTSKEDGLKYGVESLNIDMNYTSPDFHVLVGDTQNNNGSNTMAYLELDPINDTTSMSIRATHPDAHILGTKIGEIPPGGKGKAYVGRSYTYTSDKYVSGVLRAKAGDVWHYAYEPTEGWIAEKHLGVQYMRVTLIEPTPPPPPAPSTPQFIASITITDEATGKRYRADNVQLTELP